jgi:hypothetical protein
MITGVADEYRPHDSVQVVRVLVVDGDTSSIFERLTDATLN